MVNSLDCVEEGRKRFYNRTKRLQKKRQESITLHGRYFYKKTLNKLSERISLVVAKKAKAGIYAAEWKLIQDLKPLLVAHLALTTILDTLSTQQKRTAIASKIGQKMQDEINFSALKKKYPAWWKSLKAEKDKRVAYKFKRIFAVRRAASEFGDAWKQDLPQASLIRVGLSLVELFKQETGLIEYARQKVSRGRWQYVVLPTNEAIDMISHIQKQGSLISPCYLPLTDKPLDWTTLDEGGYQFPSEVGWRFLKRVRGKTKKESSYETAFNAANTLQRVPLKVNPWVSEVALRLVEFSKEEEVTRREQDRGLLLETNGNLAYRRRQAKYHEGRLKRLPKLIATDNTLTLARRFKDQTIYMPVQADFRGRLYYAPTHLNPQGSDLSRGLLEFATPTSVRGNEHWFLVGGANNWGIKGSLQERQDWVLSHEKQIKAVADDPLGNRWWQDASSPYPFLAFCREFKEWITNRITFKTHQPVRLDHTASGLQIVAALTKDEELLRLTNVAHLDYPNDIYSSILSKLKEGLQMSHRPEDHSWISLGIDRDLVKKLTVSYMYGSTYYGLEKTLIKWYVEQSADIFKREVYKEARLLLHSYYKALNAVSETPMKFMEETRQRQKDEVLSWTTPSGFPVSNDYRKSQSVRIKTLIMGEAVVCRANIDTRDFSQRAARQALPANLVHAYDSAILHTVLTSEEWPLIMTLHDCYCIPPAYCDKIQKNIKSTLCGMFGLDLPQDVVYTAS